MSLKVSSNQKNKVAELGWGYQMSGKGEKRNIQCFKNPHHDLG